MSEKRDRECATESLKRHETDRHGARADRSAWKCVCENSVQATPNKACERERERESVCELESVTLCVRAAVCE